MSDPARTQLGWKDVLLLAAAVVSPIALVTNTIRTTGGQDEQLQATIRRVDRLEATQESTGKQVLDRLARIETKVEVLMPAKPPAH